MSRFVSALLALLLAGPAIAQPNPQFNQTQTYQSFTPTGRATDLSATTSTSRVALGSSAGVAWVCNTGATNTVYVQLGTVTVTAVVATSFPIPAGRCAALNSTGATHIAGITASSSTTVQTVLGTGSPGAALGSGGGAGGSGTVTSVSVVTANGLAGTVATATTTPAITLTTSVTGSICGNGTALSACTTTGSGSTVLATSPTLITPALGTPASGIATNLTGTAAGLTAGNVTTNANLTGPITSIGNATSIASQTGTGTKFVVDTSPTLVTPTLGVATGTSLALGGATIGANALAVTGQVTNTGGTITTSQPFTISQTLNNSGVTFTGLLLNVTNTSSGANSLAFDVQVDNASKLGMDLVNARLYATGGVWASLALSQGSTFRGMTFSGTNILFYSGSSGASGAALTIPSGQLNFFQLRSTGGFSFASTDNASGTADTVLSRNAAGVIQFGTTAANALGSWLAVNGTLSGALVVSGTADASAVTGSGALQVAGGASIAKRLWIPAITASAGLQTAVLCQSSGGEMIADSVACLASSERFKTILGSAETGALDKLMRLPIYRWKYNEEGIFKSDEWTRERIGPTAEETAAIDPRLVGYGSDGKIRNVSTEQLLSLTIQAIQELKADNDNLRETIIKRAANGG